MDCFVGLVQRAGPQGESPPLGMRRLWIVGKISGHLLESRGGTGCLLHKDHAFGSLIVGLGPKGALRKSVKHLAVESDGLCVFSFGLELESSVQRIRGYSGGGWLCVKFDRNKQNDCAAKHRSPCEPCQYLETLLALPRGRKAHNRNLRHFMGYLRPLATSFFAKITNLRY